MTACPHCGCELPIQRTKKQNDGFHAMITPWARDEGHEIDSLKLDLLGRVFGWRDKRSLDGNLVPNIMHTSDLDVAQMSELIEQTMVIAARMNYILEAPDEYTARKKAEQAA